jgi:hypothetical protein
VWRFSTAYIKAGRLLASSTSRAAPASMSDVAISMLLFYVAQINAVRLYRSNKFNDAPALISDLAIYVLPPYTA